MFIKAFRHIVKSDASILKSLLAHIPSLIYLSNWCDSGLARPRFKPVCIQPQKTNPLSYLVQPNTKRLPYYNLPKGRLGTDFTTKN